MKAYMGYSRSAGACEGAVLIFASSAKEARKIAANSCISEIASGWIDVTVRWLKDQSYLLELLPSHGGPCYLEAPPTCKCCLCWGNSKIGEDGLCNDCRDVDDCVVDEDT